MRLGIALLLCTVFVGSGVARAGQDAPPAYQQWLAAAAEKAEQQPTTAPEMPGVQEKPAKPPPLPLHNIEGVGGGLITPMAYLVNPGPEGTIVALPSASFSYLNTNHTKQLEIFSVTQTFLRRIELGYSVSRFYLGNWVPAMEKAVPGSDIRRHDVYLHNFNIRLMIIDETQFREKYPWMPSLTAGVHFKVNNGINSVNRQALGAPASLGYKRDNGEDYTLTLSKMLPPEVFGRPVILSVGMRNSKASNIGYTGFTDKDQTSVETNVAVLLTKHLAVGYEFRYKTNPLNGTVHNTVGNEGPWHSILVAWLITDRLSLAGAYGYLGEVGNSDVEAAWGLQLKYEF